MIPRVATVLSARDWEPALVGAIRESAAARLILRAYQPAELEERRDELDVVVAGAETSWVTSASIAAWRRSGLRVVGIYPDRDSPARRILETGGADEILSEDSSSDSKIAAIGAVCAHRTEVVDEPTGVFVAVTGSRGAPGRSEVALALAWNLAPKLDTLLLDADLEAPSVAIRLGLAARPDLADAADGCRVDGKLPNEAIHTRDGLSFIVGSHRPGEPALRGPLVEDVLDAALGRFDVVIADLGPSPAQMDLLKRADVALLVANADAVGIVRAAQTAADWAGPPPALVLNRVHQRSARDSVQAARKWLGLDPAVVIPVDRRISAAARAAEAPARSIRFPLARLGVGS